jgi:hypothetical protein
MGNLSTYGGVSNQVLANLRGRGVRSPWGVTNYSTARALYVRSTGPVDGDPKEIINGGDFYTTVAAALDHCRTNQGDQVICLPGHTETISTADAWPNLKAGTSIVGWGSGTLRPTVTWSAAAATVLFNVANVNISNFIFNMAGDPSGSTALTVAAPITVSAAGCGFHGIDAIVGVDADQLCTKAITTTDAAKRLEITDSFFFGAASSQVTTVFEILGCDYMRLINAHVQATTASPTTIGVMRLNATALVGGYVEDCTFMNTGAAGTHAVTGVASSSGICRKTGFGVLQGTANLDGWQTKASWQFFDCHTANAVGEASAPTTPVSA